MERLLDLYFELSNDDRVRILYLLEKERMNLTAISKKLDRANQECSRHISRLMDRGLVEKHPDGAYGLTEYGCLLLRLIPGQLFAVRHRDYLSTHSLSRFPAEFVARLGELQESRLTSDVWVTFNRLEAIFKGAQEYVWMIHDQYLLNILPLGVEALKRGVRLRSIDPLSKEPERRLDSERPYYIGEEDEEYLMKCWEGGHLDVRLADSIDVFLYVSDAEAVLAFPILDGSFDYLGFTSTDAATRRLCMDVFNYYWERGHEPTKERAQETHFARRRFHRDQQ
jgi:predicted transcriptional regulator